MCKKPLRNATIHRSASQNVHLAINNGSASDAPDEQNVGEVVLDPTFPNLVVCIGATLSLELRDQVIKILKANQDRFA